MWEDCLDWKTSDGQLLYQDGSIKIIVKGEDIRYWEEAKNYSLNPYFLREWKKYRVIIRDEEKDRVYTEDDVNVFFGEDKAVFDRDFNFWEFIFKNYIGKSEIRIYLEDRLLSNLKVEVLSNKLTLNKEDKLFFYPNFYRRLIDDLTKQLLQPFEITSPTYLNVCDLPVPPNLLIRYHQILQNLEKVREGISTIVNMPHKELTIKREYVDLNEVENVDPDVCVSIVQNPAYLVKRELNLPVCQKLNGCIPRKVLQFKNIDTFNTPENRFVKRFIKELLNDIKLIKENYSDKIRDEIKKNLDDFKENLEVLLLSRCFQEVDDTNFPLTFNSQVLLKKDGYREILQVYNDLLLSKLPIFTYLQEKIDQRNIAEMYEFWCFFELSKKLAEHFKVDDKKFKINVETTLEGGLFQNRVKSIIGDYELIYNKVFRGRKESYSVALRPDFTLHKDKKVLIVFDAKFRFEIKIKNGELESEPAEDSEEKALQELKVERVANISDIFKMHTYKDALGAKSAIILYPGESNVFYLKNKPGKIEGGFNKVFEKICGFEEGVGYLSFIPGGEATENS